MILKLIPFFFYHQDRGQEPHACPWIFAKTREAEEREDVRPSASTTETRHFCWESSFGTGYDLDSWCLYCSGAHEGLTLHRFWAHTHTHVIGFSRSCVSISVGSFMGKVIVWPGFSITVLNDEHQSRSDLSGCWKYLEILEILGNIRAESI